MRRALCVAAALVAGCGDPEPTEQGSGPVLVAALGDSITEGAPYGPHASWTATAQRLMPGTRFRNCGISGERTDEILSRMHECVRGARVVVAQGGSNDIAQGYPVVHAADNLRAMVARAKALGRRAAVTEVPPWSNGHPQATPRLRALNREIRRIAREETAWLVRWYRVVEGAPGRLRGTPDGDHPDRAGYVAMGEAAAHDLGSIAARDDGDRPTAP